MSTDHWNNFAHEGTRYRWKPLGFRVQLQRYDDSVNEWEDMGVYKDEDDVNRTVKGDVKRIRENG